MRAIAHRREIGGEMRVCVRLPPGGIGIVEGRRGGNVYGY